MTPDRSVRLDRALGALLGLAAGDALGTTLEFADRPPPPPGARLTGPHRAITGGGPFDVLPGQVTDDTHLACAVARSLDGDALDGAALARELVAWARVTFDIGATTRAAVDAIARGEPAPGRAVWEASGRRGAANGALMRTAPIGVLLCDDPAARRRAALADAALTHFDPRCQLASAAFDAAIAAGVRGAADAGALADAAAAELPEAAAALAGAHPELAGLVARARADLEADLAAARRDDPDLAGPEVHLARHAGFVRVAFRLAFWELLHADGVEDGLVDVVNRGADADTNGAIAGALLGARHGARAIPAAWRRAVSTAAPAEPALATAFHPRALVDVLAARWAITAAERQDLLPDASQR